VVREIAARLQFLNDVGLNYLSLDRSADTLSGGEAQRIRLASQIGSGLTGVMYVLDEPSIGLHQRDNDRLIATLKHLRDIGNSVIVVEHDEDMMRAADHVIDMGPGAGVHGGRVMAQGSDGARQPAVAHRPVPAGTRALPCLPPHALAAGAAAAPEAEPSRASRSARPPQARRAHGRAPRQRAAGAARAGRHGNNLKGVTWTSRGPAHLRDRRLGLGQEHAGQRHAVRRRRAPFTARTTSPRRTRPSRASSISTRSSTSTRAPSAARRAATRPPTPACSRPSAS
jgi:excinuclease ABC subunit A